MIDPTQLLGIVVRPTLLSLGPGLLSTAAEQLVMGTAAQESRLSYLRQIGAGPALGLWQIEPATETDVWDNWLAYRGTPAAIVTSLLASMPSRTRQLATNLAYGCAMCRLIYYRHSDPLPQPGDVDGLAQMWKRIYNTRGGAGTVDQFKWSWKMVEGCWATSS